MVGIDRSVQQSSTLSYDRHDFHIFFASERFVERSREI